MSKVGMQTKLKNARRAKHRVDMQCKALAARVKHLEARLAEQQAERRFPC